LGYLPAEWLVPSAGEQILLNSALDKLRLARVQQNVLKDTKINAGLNGLALSTLSAAMRVDPAYGADAAQAYRFISQQLLASGRLHKSVSKGKKIGNAELEDYAYVTQGFLDYANASGDVNARQHARQLARAAWTKFTGQVTSGGAGWRHEQQALLATIQPEAVLADGASPSPSAALIMASLCLDDVSLSSRARQALRWKSESMARDVFSYPSQLRAYQMGLTLHCAG
jgi:uncharacterized protein YyaL (SSP411 family)